MQNAFPLYNNFVKHVIDWNRACGNEQFGSVDRLNKQMKYTISEIKETVDGVAQNDMVEVLDGLIDVFVTYNYLVYLKDPEYFNNTEFKYMDEGFPSMDKDIFLQAISNLMVSLHSLLEVVDLETEELDDDIYQYALMLGIQVFGQEVVEKAFQEVMNSNDSKLILKEEFDKDSENIMTKVNELYKGEFENIVPVEVTFKGQPHVVIKSDNGEGKILKPLTYFKPIITL